MTTSHGSEADLSTRQGLEVLADRLAGAASSYASPSQSLWNLPGLSSASGRWSDGLEGYARTFLLASFRVGGARGEDPSCLLERYARGLAAGTDPSSSERWPTVAERRQAVVEGASIAIALSETRPWLWDVLDDAVRQRTVEWLSGIVGTTGYTNNWIWFQNVIEAFLRSVGGPWSQADLDRNEDTQEALYVGDGWYSDGRSATGRRSHYDYYAGWAWHVYPLLRARIDGRPLEPLHRERLSAYLAQARLFVGSTGAPLFQGRSLTYRFGMLAPFWAGVLAEASPFETGATRQLAGSVLDHFIDAGAIDGRGLLTIGWHGEFERIRQVYTSSSSPYWASKGFLGLLLPPEHAEWSTQPSGLEAPRDQIESLRAPGWLVARTRDGIVRMFNHGSDGAKWAPGSPRADDPFYGRITYSNLTSPDLSRESIAAPLDSHVALLDARGLASHRDAIERVFQSDAVAVSRSRVHWLDLPGADGNGGVGDVASWSGLRVGPVLTVASVVHDAHEVRLAWWDVADGEVSKNGAWPGAAVVADAVWPRDAGPWRIRMGGWPLPCSPAEASAAARRLTDAPTATASRADGLTTHVRGLRGFATAGVTERSGDTPMGGASTATPWCGTGEVEEGEVVAAHVSLTSAPLPQDLVPPQVEVSETVIVIRWADGTTHQVPRRSSAEAAA
ncbi:MULTISPECIES: DUF2264 domain-containing protein [unclassified Pseudoclavibacter]|uniref:DUF2264 domain-containing protein n=1 Tax=unclassified Pseudoclavibacter TaxID=2615177 RepID=UPI001BACEDC4|nr:DUF2264 domain-containing protein [Pseudoclavibacter sp. Marseille-Q4354]MBS3179866.1 DUF2264 domain-containing protein [Pseudoclavibacter sp. Marseille-Q4354]